MKYIKATIMLIVGMIEAVVLFPVMFFVLPVRKWNETLYGKHVQKISIKELDNGKIKITLPNGEVMYGTKEENKKANA